MEDVAIVGMACIFPGAKDIREYWQNIISKVDAISDPPEDWEAERYFDAHSTANDRIYCKRGGYLGNLARFEPLEFGVMPSSLDGGEPDHYLALRVAKEALSDAGYTEKTINPERSEVIIGRGTYINRGVTNAFQHSVAVEQTIEILKELQPQYNDEELHELKKILKKGLPPFTAEIVPSLVPNVLAGRIANRLNFMGTNYLVDAACASSLIAVEHGIDDLINHKCDLALVGGVNASIPPTMLVIFCLINALSRQPSLRPFDESCDGTMLGEGLGFVVLKRKTDAEKEGNRIYAIMKSVGVASDGRALGLLTPRLEGEVLAIKRAYDRAGISPQTIELIEAHGTGTPVGDATEVEALRKVFGQRNGNRPSCAFGTVKSMIGHLIPASGMAGLIKTALSLYHKVLPPTLCDKPNPNLKLNETPFYMNTETRPWIHGNRDFPRRAGVNAFGFGGINAHTIMEEYIGGSEDDFRNLHYNWDTEVFFFSAGSRQDLIKEMEKVNNYLKENPEALMKDLAYTLNTKPGDYPHRLTIVASSGLELSKKIVHAAERLRDTSCTRIRDRKGIYYFDEPLGRQGKIAFLFPGEGSQYTNMFSDLCIHFPEVRSSFDLMDRAFINHHRGYLPSHTVFSLPLGQETHDQKLWAMDIAAESVFTANQAMLKLMNCLEIKPDVLIGHSTGEYSALIASGMIRVEEEDQFIHFVLGVNKVYEKLLEEGQLAEGILLSVGAAKRDYVEKLMGESPGDLYIAMDNCPNQIVLCGSEKAINKAEEKLRESGALLERLPFRRAYHTPMFESLCTPLLEYFKGLEISRSQIQMYSCVTAQPYPDGQDEIRQLATTQWARCVRFKESIEAMYNDGVRIFIEVGPRGNLTAFADDILKKQPHLAVPSNLHRQSGITQLNHLIGLLTAHHVYLNASFLYKYRMPLKLAIGTSDKEPLKPDVLKKPVKIDLTLPRLTLQDSFGGLRSKQSNEERTVVSQKIQKTSEPSPLNMRSKIMLEHMKNMERFLEIQKEVFQTYLKKRSKALTPEHVEDLEILSHMKFPFIREIISLDPGKQVVALCKLDFQEDKFLVDHTLGGSVSDIDREILALSVVPLTFSMEIMAEGAALLMEGKKLIGMREIRAYRWIGLDTGSKTLQIIARKNSSNEREVKVEIREMKGAGIQENQYGLPITEGIMIFDQNFPDPPSCEDFSLRGARDSKWADADLYSGFMFHGPSLQGVASMERIGEDGAAAILKTLPEEDLLHSIPHPNFLSDPVILDAAGQVIAYWTSDCLTGAYHIFPFRLEELYFYGPRFTMPEAAKCRAKIELIDDMLVRSDIDIIDSEGKLRMRLLGWWDRRFDQPEKFFQLRVSPKNGMLSVPYLKDFKKHMFSENFTCCLLNEISRDFLTAHDKIWLRVMANLVLSRKERQFWYGFSGTDKRRTDWLLGRTAAKDAVRLFLQKHDGMDICPADIEISTDESGRPFIESIRGGEIKSLPAVSIAHSAGAAIAIADSVLEGYSIGVDFEFLRALEKNIDQVAFNEEEKEFFSADSDSGDNEWRFRLWCAKESVSKALGSGFRGSPRNFIVKTVDKKTGEIGIIIAEEISSMFPGLIGKQLIAYTLIEDGLVFAISICKTR